MSERFYSYRGCGIIVKEMFKRHKGQIVRTIAYCFHIWTPDELGQQQYRSKKSESFSTEGEALEAAQRVIDAIFTVIEKRYRNENR